MIIKKNIFLWSDKAIGAIGAIVVITICHCAINPMSLNYSHLYEKYLILRGQSVVPTEFLDQVVYSDLINHPLL